MLKEVRLGSTNGSLPWNSKFWRQTFYKAKHAARMWEEHLVTFGVTQLAGKEKSQKGCLDVSIKIETCFTEDALHKAAKVSLSLPHTFFFFLQYKKTPSNLLCEWKEACCIRPRPKSYCPWLSTE